MARIQLLCALCACAHAFHAGMPLRSRSVARFSTEAEEEVVVTAEARMEKLTSSILDDIAELKSLSETFTSTSVPAAAASNAPTSN